MMAHEPRTTRRSKVLNEPAPEPAPMQIPRPRPISIEMMALVDTWFADGCLSKREAARKHGYASAQSFLRPDVRSYIAECMARRQEYMARTEAEIIAELEKIGFSNVGDLLEVQPDGSAWMDMTALTPDMRAAVQEYTVETYTETKMEDGELVQVPVKKAKVKFYDKKAALDSLSRIHGMNQDKVEIGGAANLVEQIANARKRLQPKE